jgi:hypothetical protein
MSDFELPPSPPPDALFQPVMVSRRSWRQPKIYVAAAVGFLAGALSTWAVMRNSPRPSSATPAELAREVDALKPVIAVAMPPAESEPTLVSTPAPAKRGSKQAQPPVAPMPTEIKPPSAQAVASGSTLTLTANGASAAQAGIVANAYIDGDFVGRTPINARPVVSGKRVVRFDCIWKGKAYKGDDTEVEVPPHTDATVEHKCDVWVWIGVPDDDKQP